MSHRLAPDLPPETAFLLLCAQPTLSSEHRTEAATLITAGLDADTLLAVAHAHGLGPLLYRGLLELGQAAESLADLIALLADEITSAALLYEFIYPAQLACLLQAFEQASIPTIVLKGHTLAALYGQPMLRPYGDIDLLLPPDRLEEAEQIMLVQGYHATPPDHPREWYLANYHHLPPYLHPEKAPVELHFRLTKPHIPVQIKLEELWQRAEPFTLEGCHALMLCPEHTLIYLCIHATGHHLFSLGLKPFCDIATTLTAYQDRIDWEGVLYNSQRWHCTHHVVLGLRLTKALFAVTIPDDTLNRLNEEEITPFVRYGLTNALALKRNILPLAQAIQTPGAARRMTLIRDKLFPPRADLADYYGLMFTPVTRLLYRLRWIGEITGRQIKTLRQFHHGEDTTRRQFAHEATRTALLDWLAHED